MFNNFIAIESYVISKTLDKSTFRFIKYIFKNKIRYC